MKAIPHLASRAVDGYCIFIITRAPIVTGVENPHSRRFLSWLQFGAIAVEATVPQNLRDLQFRGNHRSKVSAAFSIPAMSHGGAVPIAPWRPQFGDAHSRVVLSECRRSVL
jgi:hypothetical protein